MNQKRNQNFENTLLKQTLLFCFVLSQCMSHLGLNLNIYLIQNVYTRNILLRFVLIGLVAIGIGMSSGCGFWGDLASAQFTRFKSYAMPNALCFKPEFSNRLRGVLIQWFMGFLLSLKYLTSKGGEAIPLALSRYDTPMKK